MISAVLSAGFTENGEPIWIPRFQTRVNYLTLKHFFDFLKKGRSSR